MYTFKEESDEGDAFYTIRDGDRKMGEVWNKTDALSVVYALNKMGAKKLPTMPEILSAIEPTEPHNPALFGGDIDKLITACRQSQEVDTSRHLRRLLMSFLAARLNAYVHETHTTVNDNMSAGGGLRILIAISFVSKPGIINGLSRDHKPVHELWSLDAQQYWVELHRDFP